MNFLPNPSASYTQYDSLGSGGIGSVAALYGLNKAGILSQDQMNSMLTGNKNMSGNMLNSYLKSPSGSKPPSTTSPVIPGQSSIAPQAQDDSTQVAESDPSIIDNSLPNFANALVGFGGSGAIDSGLAAFA